MCHVHVFAKVPRYAREDSKPLQPSPHHTIPLDDDVVKRAQNLLHLNNNDEDTTSQFELICNANIKLHLIYNANANQTESNVTKHVGP
jgi:hypothetical protein